MVIGCRTTPSLQSEKDGNSSGNGRNLVTNRTESNTGSTVVLQTGRSSVLVRSSTRIASKKLEGILVDAGRSSTMSFTPPLRPRWCPRTNAARWVTCLRITSSTKFGKWNAPSLTGSVAYSGSDRIRFTATDSTPVLFTATSLHLPSMRLDASSTPPLENHRSSTGYPHRFWNPVRMFSPHSSPDSPRYHSVTAFFHPVSRSPRLRHCWRSRDWTVENQPTTDRFRILTTSQRYSKDCS